SYTPSLNFNGNDTLTLYSNDNGQLGGGGALTDSDNVIIHVTAVNDAPVVHVPSNHTTNEDTAWVISNSSLSVTDVDAGSANLTVNLKVNHGNLTLTSSNATVTGSNGNLTIYGSLSTINTALGSVTYTPSL